MTAVTPWDTFDPSEIDMDGFHVDDGMIALDGDRPVGYVLDDSYEADPLLREWDDPYWNHRFTGE